MTLRKDILSLQQINLRLTEIEQERLELLLLKQQIESSEEVEVPKYHLTTQEKVRLFKQRFRGRNDIYANRWENKQGRSGYSVACDHEWVKGICEKPRIKCQDCLHRKFSELSEQVIFNHLLGNKVVGLYPLMPDSSCFLLAADFDKNNWREEVQAMSKACDFYCIDHLIEISRSGNGGHLWIFFAEAVNAKDARQLGFMLLDKAMEAYPSLSFDSYDRLFPNQDVMPEGGFGNLIALPLQKQARKNGNSSFVTQELSEIHDQWKCLHSVKPLSKEALTAILDSTSYQMSLHQSNREISTEKPWEVAKRAIPLKLDIKPSFVKVTLANYLYFNLIEVPSQLVARLRRIATFSNPVFYKTQAMRFSTHGIPRFITCAHIQGDFLAMPRGCLDEVIALLESVDVEVVFEDKRQPGTNLSILKLDVDFRAEQIKAISELIKFETGILHAPTAFGKTMTAMGVIVKRGVNTLILVHSRQLLDQWKQRLQTFLPDIEVGIYGGGKKKPTNQIDIATYQSLIDKSTGDVNLIVHEYGQVIVDECHHLSAPLYERVMNEVRAKYVLGLTATPERQDGHQKIIFMTAGPIRFKAETKQDLFKQTVLVKSFYQEPPEELISKEVKPKITEVYQWLMGNIERNQYIIDMVLSTVEKGGHPIVLTERREHAEKLSQSLIEKGLSVVCLHGGMGLKQRKQTNEALGNASVVVATGKYIGEGFDLPRLDTLFLAMPIAWRGSLAQYAGRIQRQVEGKVEVKIYDFVDEHIPMLQRMFTKREKSYQTLGYEVKY